MFRQFVIGGLEEAAGSFNLNIQIFMVSGPNSEIDSLIPLKKTSRQSILAEYNNEI